MGIVLLVGFPIILLYIVSLNCVNSKCIYFCWCVFWHVCCKCCALWHATIHCHFSQEWTKLDKSDGAPWPVGRCDHAACCLNYGDDQPALLMTGGIDKNHNTLNDAWLLDVYSRRWKEVRECRHLWTKYLTIAASFPLLTLLVLIAWSIPYG